MRVKPIPFTKALIPPIIQEAKSPGTGKHQTRRILDNHCDDQPAFVRDGVITSFDENEEPYRWPRTHAVGDVLWVREPHYLTDDGEREFAVYAADEDAVRNHLERIKRLPATFPEKVRKKHLRARPGMFLPRWASRITLEVTDVRIQRVQDISEEDAIAEGVSYPKDLKCLNGPISAFKCLWTEINGDDAWRENPWVVAYTFRAMLANVDLYLGAMY